MEKTIRIIQQSELTQRQYPDKKTGEQKVLNVVMLKMTDGLDTFFGEINGERAVNCPRYFGERSGKRLKSSFSRFSPEITGMLSTANLEVSASLSSLVPAYP